MTDRGIRCSSATSGASSSLRRSVVRSCTTERGSSWHARPGRRDESRSTPPVIGSASGALRVLIGAEETRPYWSSTPRGASNGGATFHDRGGPYGRTKGDKRVVAVDATGFPVGALVVPASTHGTAPAN